MSRTAVLLSCAATYAAAATSNLRGEVQTEVQLGSAQQTGLYQNYPISDLINDGYSECYTALYSSVTNSSHLDKCSSDPTAMIVVGALYGTSATTIKIGAGGLSRNIFAETSSTSTAYCYDGACWYNFPGRSFGFSGTYYVSLNPTADTYSSTDYSRVSWNLDNGLGGYRAGSAINLNSDSTYRKVIYRKVDPLFSIKENYAIYDLTKQGFKECYNAPYSDITTQDDLSKCNADPNKKVFVGALKTSSSSSFMLGAGGVAGNVFTATSSSSTAVLRNGVYWYNVNGKSFGFAPTATIYLEDADTYDIASTQRLSWHVNEQAGGWRAGADNSLTNDNTHRKVIYVQY